MSRRPHSHYRSAALEVVGDRLHLFVGKVLESQEDNHQVRGFQRFGARHIVIARYDFTRLFVDVKEYCALEAVILGKDLGQRGECFFAPVLVVTCQKHNMFAATDSVGHRFVVIDQRLCHQVHGQPRNQNGKRNQT